MKVVKIGSDPKVYAGNAYLILGDWNRLDDVNTLIDAGADDSILDSIAACSTGVGKNPVEQVILTHSHFDHNGGLTAVMKQYHPRVYAMAPQTVPSMLLFDEQQLWVGDTYVEVMTVAEHSNDSVCFYAPRARVLFSGDTPIQIMSPGGSYHRDYVAFLERLLALEIETVYPGHGQPLTGNIQEIIRHSLVNIAGQGAGANKIIGGNAACQEKA